MHTNGDFTDLFKLYDFCWQFDASPNSVECVRKEIELGDWRYRRLTEKHRDRLIRQLIADVDAGMSKTGDPRKWERAWSQKRTEHITRNVDHLRPDYFQAGKPMRINGDFAITANPDFEWEWYKILMHWLANTYLEDVDEVWEFGCGTGHNLVGLSHLYPHKKYVGLDWSDQACNILSSLGQRYPIEGGYFDFFQPDYDARLPAGAAVLTVGALEQTGTRWQAFLGWLLDNHPRIVVHVEPIYEWYDQTLFDYTAMRMMHARNYWVGYPGALALLEEKGVINIHKMHRTRIGSVRIEGYMLTVWGMA